jgi:hypothetical protein
MKAIVQHEYGAPQDVLGLADVQMPVIGTGDVLVSVRASSANPWDWHYIRGEPVLLRPALGGIRKPKFKIPGGDVAGTVQQAGSGVTAFKSSDDVYGFGHGAFAEYTAVPHGSLALKPQSLTFEQAAAVPLAVVTALQGLRAGGLQPGQDVLMVRFRRFLVPCDPRLRVAKTINSGCRSQLAHQALRDQTCRVTYAGEPHMRRSFHSPAASSLAMVVLVSLGAVCVLGPVPQPAFAAGTAPPAPAGLNLQANANSSITLTWDPTPGATGYNIYRATSSGGEGSTPIASTARRAYTDINLSSTPVYFYEVTAVNSAGESSRSAQDASKTSLPAGTGGNVPGVPSGNSLIFYSKDALLGGLDWFQTLTGWYPEALPSPGSISPGHQVIDMAYATQSTMTFKNVVVPARGLYTVDWRYAFASGLFPGVTDRQMGLEVDGRVITTTERFVITGSFNIYRHATIQVHLKAGKNSITLFAVSDHGVSRVDQMTITPATASVPSGPANLTATTGSRSVKLRWTRSTSGNPASYSIYRGSMPDGEATTPIATINATTTTFTDSGLKNHSTYFYQVTANNAVGASTGSNQIMATPGVTTLKGTNLALNQPAYASSIQVVGYPASAAVDDNFNTRWASLFFSPQWLLVDLGAMHKISRVALYWEKAYARAFQIQVSRDGINWTTIYSTTRGTGGTQILAVNGTGRYIRMYGTQRGTRYGYSLWDFQAFGA